MSEHRFRALARNDPAIETMTRLLQDANLPTTDLWEGPSEYFVIGNEVGFGGLTLFPSTGLLRSVVVNRPEQRRGIGRAIVVNLLDIAQARGVRDIWLLTASSAPFFAQCGFAPAGRNDAPPVIAELCQFRSLCPASATLMNLSLV